MIHIFFFRKVQPKLMTVQIQISFRKGMLKITGSLKSPILLEITDVCFEMLGRNSFIQRANSINRSF